MLYNYIALIAFAILAFLVSLALIAASKLLARRSPGNAVKNAPWESGEESTGNARDVQNEYLPFFSLFLPFEVITGIIVVWATVAYGVGYFTSVGIIVLALAAGVAAGFGYKTIVS
jgi:NADH:ubiquinone oxidoreductase subunit 3 (subunit A)